MSSQLFLTKLAENHEEMLSVQWRPDQPSLGQADFIDHVFIYVVVRCVQPHERPSLYCFIQTLLPKQSVYIELQRTAIKQTNNK